MIKRGLLCLLSVILAVVLSGCWNYRSLDQMNIVVGIAIDFDEKENLFDITYEVADMTRGDKNSNVVGKAVNAQGVNLFDTARNVKRKEADRLFFGTTHLLIINQQVIQKIGILPMLDWFLRDGECRETVCIAISEEKTASEMLKGSEEATHIVSVVLYDILRKDKDVTGTSFNIYLYQVYNNLHSPRNSAVIPVLRKIENGDQEIAEINGMAVLKGEELAGFLSPRQSKYVTVIENELNSGILPISMSDDMPTHDLALEIFFCETGMSYAYEQDRITISIDTHMDVAVAENQSDLDMMDEQVIRQIEETASRVVAEDIKELMDVLQHEFGADVLGFGDMIYKSDLELWNQISSSWDEIYPTIEVEVSAKIEVMNTAFTK